MVLDRQDGQDSVTRVAGDGRFETWQIDAATHSFVVADPAAGTRILTDYGPVPVENLRRGDLVVTRDCGMQPIAWIGARILPQRLLSVEPDQRPILIRAGALGPSLPNRDLYLSPQQWVRVTSEVSRHLFGIDELLVMAKRLLPLDGVSRVSDCGGFTCFHLLLEGPGSIYANGVETSIQGATRPGLSADAAQARSGTTVTYIGEFSIREGCGDLVLSSPSGPAPDEAGHWRAGLQKARDEVSQVRSCQGLGELCDHAAAVWCCGLVSFCLPNAAQR
ncbi:MAG: Hint domain-containing protein [Paracoccus sp. (in: a-proteobacteria)]